MSSADRMKSASEKKLAMVEEDFKSAKVENEKDIIENLDKKPVEQPIPTEEKLKGIDKFLEGILSIIL
jgi:hypothetical protein